MFGSLKLPVSTILIAVFHLVIAMAFSRPHSADFVKDVLTVEREAYNSIVVVKIALFTLVK
jgi:hypothetical protein